MHYTTRCLTLFNSRGFLSCWPLVLAVSTFAQSSTTSPSLGDSKKEEAVILSPFTVDSSQDRGYLSKNTLSGTGSSESLLKIPQTIEIANQELIQDLGVGSGDLLKALEMTSGSIVRRSFNNGDDQYLWGFRLNNSMRDGVPRSVGTPLGAMYDVDRIEVVKGPSAALFGQASFIGGVINYVTRQPTRTPRYSAQASYGSYDYVSLALHASGPLNSKLRYRADVGGTEYTGARRGTYYRDRFFGAGIEYAFSPTTILSINGSHMPTHRYHSITILDPSGKGEIWPQAKDFSVNEPWARYDWTSQELSATLTTTLADGLSSRTAVTYNRAIRDMLRDSTDGQFNAGTKTVGKTGFEQHIDDRTLFVAQTFLQVLDTGPLHHKIRVGGDVRFQHIPPDYARLFDLQLTGFSLVNPVYGAQPASIYSYGPSLSSTETRNRISGVYIEDTVSFWRDRVQVLGGYRFNDSYGTSGTPIVSYSGSTPPQTVSAGSVDSKRYGVVIHPTEHLSVYYNNAEAFIFNSGFKTLPLNNPPPLVPSIGTNREIGLKAQFFNGALQLTVARFDIKVSNVRIVYVQGPNDPFPGTSAIGQDGFQTNKGYDISIAGSKSFESGVVNFIATHYQGDIVNEIGLKPLGIANTTDSVWGVFEFGKGLGLSGLKMGAGARYTGQRVGPGPGRRLEPYTTARALLAYKWGKTRIQLNIDNLTDKEYVDGLENAFWVTTDPGRTYKLTVDYTF